MALVRLGVRLLVAAALVAGCGGGGDERFDAGATRTCLERAGALVSSEDAEYVVQEGLSRGYEVTVGENRLSMAFEGSSAAAERTEKGFARFFVGGSKLQRRGNTVLAWDKPPTGAERTRVEDCLKSSDGAE
jgi:hypothetical protein